MSHRTYYWIYSVGEDGRPYVIRGGDDEAEARAKASMYLANYKIIPLRTTSQQAASSQIRGMRLENGRGIVEAARRQGHEATLRRQIRRQESRR